MKRYILFIIIILLLGNLFAQSEWASVGTIWYYNLRQDYEYGYLKIESEKDTIVLDKKCQYLTIEKNVYSIPGVYIRQLIDSLITYQEGEKIYVFQNNAFSLLYDFNPTVGDVWDISKTWNTYNTLNTGYDYLDTLKCEKGKVKVDSIVNISLNNRQFKSIYTSPYNNSSMEYSGPIIEGIGCVGYMMPISKCNQHLDSWYPYPIRCFFSKDFNFSWSKQVCDYITKVKDVELNNELSIHFNSYEDELYIKIEKNSLVYPINIKIYSLNGITLYNNSFSDKSIRISTKYLLSGIYVVEIKDNYLASFYSKFIINTK